jgi:5-methylcytosine-specific restriction endonuclease McrA
MIYGKQKGTQVMSVFVLDKRKRPLMPCSEKRARKLLDSGRARVHKLFPFCIRLTDRLVEGSSLQPLRLSLDPGSKETGIALCRVSESVDSETGEISSPVMHIQFLMELVHRGAAIKKSLEARAAMRGRRRGNLRYRAPRFNNRPKAKGWLAPSLKHRVDTTCSWVRRLSRLAPITHLAQELVRFDMQRMQAQAEGGDISGAQYQQGTLLGYEVREYLLEKFHRTCAYCDATGVPLQMEHIHPKANGGSNRISNLTLACGPCNTKKAARDIKEFLAKDPARLKRILAQAKAPLRDAAAVNSTRWALFNTLKAIKPTGLAVETGTGGQTKWNRSRLGIVKTHALDAACVGNVYDVQGANAPALRVTCTGRGSRCKTRLDQYGFPRTYLTKQKTAFGFKTGDMVAAKVTKGIKSGVHKGRVAIRLTGSFNIQSGLKGVAAVQGISHKFCRITQRADGYGYSQPKQDKEQDKKGSGIKGVLRTPRSTSRA